MPVNNKMSNNNNMNPKYSDPLSFHDNFMCETDVNIDQLSITWKINHFSFLNKKTGEAIESVKFSTDKNKDIQWRLVMYPEGQSDEFKDFISVYLGVNAKGFPIHTKYCFSILNEEGKQLFKKAYNTHKFEKEFIGNGCPRFIDRATLMSDKNDFIKDDSLIIQCSIFFYTQITADKDCKRERLKRKTQANDLRLGCYKKLFEESLHCDVVVNVNDKEIHVHKGILAANSPVFAAMFDNNMREKKLNKVVVDDISHDTAKEMFRYMYTGEVNNLSKVSSELMFAADKYAIDDLKTFIENHLLNTISINNVLDLLNLASLHRSKILKDACINYILRNEEKVVESSKFLEMKSLCPDLIIDLFTTLVSKRKLKRENEEPVPTKKSKSR